MGALIDLIVRVLTVYDPEEDGNLNDIFWNTNEGGSPIRFFVNCNDLFYWAMADCEEITADNIETLEQSTRAVMMVNPDYRAKSYGSLLFCCRVRKMRPQGAYYEYIPENLHSLFNACGPERTVQFGNPKEPQP